MKHKCLLLIEKKDFFKHTHIQSDDSPCIMEVPLSILFLMYIEISPLP